MFSHTHNFIFIHLPKTGGNTLHEILLEYSSDGKNFSSRTQDLKDRFDVVGQWTETKHQTVQRYHDIMPKEIWKKQRIVASLRHPVDRLVSNYFAPDRRLKKNDRNWIKKTAGKSLHWLGFKARFSELELDDSEFDLADFKEHISITRSISDFLRLNGKVKQPDIIIDFANFEQSVREALEKLNLPKVELPYRNKSLTAQNKNMLAKRKDVIDVVIDSRHAEDFENFSYMGWKV